MRVRQLEADLIRAHRLLWLLLAAALLLLSTAAVSTGRAAQDMSGKDILGLRVGMTVDEVNAVLSTMPSVERKTERRRQAPEGAPAGREIRAILVNFTDGRFLQISFAPSAGSSRAAEIALVYQGPSFSDRLSEMLRQRYGRPDDVKSFGQATVSAWGGKAQAEGAIAPAAGVSTTLRSEQIANKQLSVTLTAHQRPPSR